MTVIGKERGKRGLNKAYFLLLKKLTTYAEYQRANANKESKR